MQDIFSSIVYVNGEFVPAKDAVVSVFDRGFIFGDGVYEVVPVVNGVMVDRDEFWQRFENSLKAIELSLPVSKAEFENMLNELIAKNSLKEGGLYMQITRGVAPRDFYFIKGLKPTCMAYAFEKKIFDNLDAKKGIEVVSTPDIRWKRRDIKSISLLGQCIAKEVAHKAGVYEAFMVEDGYVTEASSSSVFIIKDGVLITKPLSNEILPGIRRKVILGFASELGLKIEERKFSMDEVYGADEVFISAATLMILPVIKADNRLINSGKIGEFSKAIRERYALRFKKAAGLL
ncbi:MAG: D-amino acid aminotransferase [Campylobacter sp.]|nr:D-amino acid aminotransferase [Campylobacter sp.]